MPFWIDNTGLHSAGRAVDGRALGLIDVEGFLQFATLLVFGDSLLINGFEPPHVAARTVEIRERLILAGVPTSVIEVVAFPAEAYWEACGRAAQVCAKQLRWGFVGSSKNADGTHPDMPREQRFGQLELVRMATGETTIPDAASIRLDKEGRRAGLALHYMLATCPPLGGAIKELISATPHWTVSHTSQLDTYVRLFLNGSLANRAGALYTPAVARARTVREYRRHLVMELSGCVDDAVSRVLGRPLGMPALTSALLKRSKGDKDALIEEALALRHDARALRKWLTKLSVQTAAFTPDSYVLAIRELRQIVCRRRLSA